MNATENILRRAWSWVKERLKALWSTLVWLAELVCCCGCLGGDDDDDADGGGGRRRVDDARDLEKGASFSQTASSSVPQPPNAQTATMTSNGAGGSNQVHKVIMVGSGGVR